MKAAIEVRDRAEADRVKAALEDGVTRAVVVVMGAMQALEPAERRQVLTFVSMRLEATEPR